MLLQLYALRTLLSLRFLQAVYFRKFRVKPSWASFDFVFLCELFLSCMLRRRPEDKDGLGSPEGHPQGQGAVEKGQRYLEGVDRPTRVIWRWGRTLAVRSCCCPQPC